MPPPAALLPIADHWRRLVRGRQHGSVSAVSCILCGRTAFAAGDGPHRVASCQFCGLQFVTPPVSDRAAVELQVDCVVHDDSGRATTFNSIERELRSRAGRPGSVLDVGCASGPFMVVLRDRGWTPHGIDVNPGAVEAAKARGLDVTLATADDFPTPTERFDAIVLMNSLEYFPRPLQTLSMLADLLRPGGAIAVETPNTLYHRRQAAIGRRLGLARERLMIVEARPGRRLIAFAPISIRLALEQAGFVDVRIRPGIPRRAGSLFDNALRRAIFSVTGALAQSTRQAVLLSPSLIVTAIRA